MSLKELLGEELYNQVTTKLGETKIGIVSDGSYIPKTKFDEKLEEIKGYKTEIAQRDEQIGTLKQAATGNEALTQTINELEGKNQEWAGQLVRTKKEFQVKLLASSLNAHDLKYILSEVDLDSLELDENENVKGLEEKINKIKEDKPFLFKTEEPTLSGRTPTNLQTPPATTKNPWSKEHRNLTEQAKLLKDNPELAAQLKAQAGN